MASRCDKIHLTQRSIITVGGLCGFVAPVTEVVTVVTNIGTLPPLTDQINAVANPNLNNSSESFLVVPMSTSVRVGSTPVAVTATATLTPFLVGAPPIDVILTIQASSEKAETHHHHRHH
jgi:hypothetical protein